MAKRTRSISAPVAEIAAPVADVIAESPMLSPKAGFMDGHQGGPKLAWANSGAGTGFTFNNPMSPFTVNMGWAPSREANLAASIAAEFQFSNSTFSTLLDVIDVSAVGTGLTVSSKVDADLLGITKDEARALAHKLEIHFAAWAGNPTECDWTGRFTLPQIAAAGFRLAMLTGEEAGIMGWKRHQGGRFHTKLNLLNPGQIDQTITRIEDGRRIVQGVVFDNGGALIGYMIKSAPMGAQFAAPMAKFVPARTRFGRPVAFHIIELKDARQVRGVSPLIASLTPSQERDVLSERMLGSAALQACFAMTLESDDVTARDGLNTDDENELLAREAHREAFYTKSGLSVASNKVAVLAKGDRLKFNSPVAPNHTFQDFDANLTRQAARAGGATFEDVSGDYSKTNFAASRMANHIPTLMTSRRRKTFVEGLYRTAWACFVEEAIASGLVELPKNAPPFWACRDAYLKAAFLGAPPPEPDRLKAAKAAQSELELGISTLTDVLAARGTDFEDHVETLKSERAVLAEAGFIHPLDLAAVKAKAKAPEPVEPDEDDK